MSHPNPQLTYEDETIEDKIRAEAYIEMLPIKPTDSPLVKKIKYENEIGNFIFDAIVKEAK